MSVTTGSLLPESVTTLPRLGHEGVHVRCRLVEDALGILRPIVDHEPPSPGRSASSLDARARHSDVPALANDVAPRGRRRRHDRHAVWEVQGSANTHGVDGFGMIAVEELDDRRDPSARPLAARACTIGMAARRCVRLGRRAASTIPGTYAKSGASEITASVVFG